MAATWIKHGIDDDGDTLLIREKNLAVADAGVRTERRVFVLCRVSFALLFAAYKTHRTAENMNSNMPELIHKSQGNHWVESVDGDN